MNSLIVALFILALVLVAEKIEDFLGDSDEEDTIITKEDFKNE